VKLSKEVDFPNYLTPKGEDYDVPKRQQIFISRHNEILQET